MAAHLQLPSPALRPSLSLHFHPSISSINLSLRRCHSNALSLKRKHVGLATKCLATPQGMAEPFPSSPLTVLVTDFYENLNKKDMKKLQEQLDSNCIFEDLAYPVPFKGKQVYVFLEELSTSMGQNVKFRVDDVYEEGKQNAGARWHLEWNERAIPFTKGCSFFYCSENPTRLLIKKACVFVESPVKPGAVVLDLLRIVTSFFDKFPKLAIWFLEKPAVVFQFMTRAYKMLLEPLILPFLVYYTHVWTYGAKLLSFLLNLLQNALKLLM